MMKKGFTLIELLVVVSIISLLSSIVLASLSTARTKAQASAVKASLSSARNQAELEVDSMNSYVVNICTTSNTGGLATLISKAVSSGATVLCGQNTAADTRPTAWGISAALPGGETYCVDSRGYSGPAGKVTGGVSSIDVSCELKWTQCANENQFCTFTGTTQVRYGANSIYAIKTATNGISCNNTTFGDPVPGVGKKCEVLNDE